MVKSEFELYTDEIVILIWIHFLIYFISALLLSVILGLFIVGLCWLLL